MFVVSRKEMSKYLCTTREWCKYVSSNKKELDIFWKSLSNEFECKNQREKYILQEICANVLNKLSHSDDFCYHSGYPLRFSINKYCSGYHLSSFILASYWNAPSDKKHILHRELIGVVFDVDNPDVEVGTLCEFIKKTSIEEIVRVASDRTKFRVDKDFDFSIFRYFLFFLQLQEKSRDSYEDISFIPRFSISDEWKDKRFGFNVGIKSVTNIKPNRNIVGLPVQELSNSKIKFRYFHNEIDAISCMLLSIVNKSYPIEFIDYCQESYIDSSNLNSWNDLSPPVLFAKTTKLIGDRKCVEESHGFVMRMEDNIMTTNSKIVDGKEVKLNKEDIKIALSLGLSVPRN